MSPRTAPPILAQRAPLGGISRLAPEGGRGNQITQTIPIPTLPAEGGRGLGDRRDRLPAGEALGNSTRHLLPARGPAPATRRTSTPPLLNRPASQHRRQLYKGRAAGGRCPACWLHDTAMTLTQTRLPAGGGEGCESRAPGQCSKSAAVGEHSADRPGNPSRSGDRSPTAAPCSIRVVTALIPAFEFPASTTGPALCSDCAPARDTRGKAAAPKRLQARLGKRLDVRQCPADPAWPVPGGDPGNRSFGSSRWLTLS